MLSMAALSVAFVLALYSGAAARLGNLALASSTAIAALLVAGWVAVTLVPVLAKRTPLRWISYRMEYRITRQGWIYIGGIVLVALAAINTGNNLLFLILACLIASILMSGVLSSITLAGVEMRLQLPEHIFAGQSVRTLVEVKNEKQTLPSFSLRVEGRAKKGASPAAILATPVYFPYLPKNDTVRQTVPLLFPRRGLYRQEAFRIVTRFPFGFLQKARRLDLASEALVYPSVEATPEFLDVIPLIQGVIETLAKGRGQDLYALRDYQQNDSARHVHWKASARLGSLMVREFAREEDCRVVLVFDPHLGAPQAATTEQEKARFEHAVELCAAIAWNFYERATLLQFQCGNMDVPQGPAEQNIFAILRHLARVQPIPADALPRLTVDQAADPGSFQIVVTPQVRGSIAAEVWNSSYVVFAGEVGG
jgi:uncharacterized protein (DUF58 family)